MRFSRFFIGFVILAVTLDVDASAAEITIKVVDPQSAPVAEAQVELFHANTSTPSAIQLTSTDGEVVFRGFDAGPLHVRILAP